MININKERKPLSYNDTLKIPAHYNIYTGVNGRELRIDYSPQKGTNADTGIFIFVPGFGGHIDSKIYKKCVNILLKNIML